MRKLTLLFLGMALCSAMQAMTLSVDGVGFITNDTTIEVSEAEENPISGDMVMEIKGNLIANGTVTVEFSRSEEGVADQLCIGNTCNPGNEQYQQTMTFQVDGMANWYTHYTPTKRGTYTIQYCFTAEEETICLTIRYRCEFLSALNDVRVSDTQREGVYTIFGQLIREDNSTEGLPAGMYIVGGKKALVK